MHHDTQSRRREVAERVADLYANRITSSEFFATVDRLDTRDDPELAELIELVRREPANTWFFGVSGEAQRHHSQRIRDLVRRFADV